MPEQREYGSVRGATNNDRPYRDTFPLCESETNQSNRAF